MSLPRPVNPFEASADPRGYVPRVACEEVLFGLQRQLSAGAPVVLLRGPAGIGKSMLLAVLQQRVTEAWEVAQVAASPSPSVEISHRILDLLDVAVDDEPSSTLVATARRSAAAGRRVLVIIDQATHVPLASSRQIARAAVRAGGDLCVLFVVTDEEGGDAFEREIGAEADLVTVRLDAPMNEAETAEYIARRLDATLESQALRDRFDDAALRYVIDRAEGNPRRVDELAYDALHRLGNGEPLPILDRDAVASSESAMTDPATPPPAPLWQPSPLGAGAAPHASQSLGGGLLGTGPARDPSELDATRELFPPGFLRSDRDPLQARGGPGIVDPGAVRDRGDTPTPADPRAFEHEHRDPMAAGDPTEPAAPVDGVAAAQEETAVEGAAAAEDADSVEGAAAAEDAGSGEGAAAVGAGASIDAGAAVLRGASIEGVATAEDEASVEGAAAIDRPATLSGEAVGRSAAASASSKRTKLWAAALVVVAAGGGYLAGRVDPAPTAPAPLPAAVARPLARDAASVSPEPEPEPVVTAAAASPDRTRPDAPEPTAAGVASTPAPESPSPATVAIDAESSLAEAKPSAAPVPSAAPKSVSKPVSAPRPKPVATPVPAAAPKLAAAPEPVATPVPAATKKPAPMAAPRVEDMRVASDASVRSEPPLPEEPAAGAPTGEVQSTTDGSVTAIVVGARGAADRGAQASAYVRVRVQLEPGARLLVDGEPVGVAPFSDLIMEPGLHTFVAELPDGLQIEQLIQVTPETGVVEF